MRTSCDGARCWCWLLAALVLFGGCGGGESSSLASADAGGASAGSPSEPVVAVGPGGASTNSPSGPVATAGASGASAGGRSEPATGGTEPSDASTDPGQPVDLVDDPVSAEAVQQQLQEALELDAAGLLAHYAVPFQTELGYDPADAVGLDLVQSSTLALSAEELALLSQHGFVISSQERFPSFAYAYTTAYSLDLPVFVSADSILDALHRSYDAMLKSVEYAALVPQLTRLLGAMRSRLVEPTSLSAQVAQDLDFYLTVAASLLSGQTEAPSTGIDASEIGEFVDAATAAAGMSERELFGVDRRFDFSQFEPRGHYEEDEVLQRYFRTMMWLGRIDFRLIETQEDHSQVFRRRQLEAALGLRELMGEQELSDWSGVDAAITAFVGEHDYMTVPQLAELLEDLGATGLEDLAGVADETIAQAILDGGYGTQRISSHIMINGTWEGTLPLSSSFAFFGQRYAVDSHVFSNLVYDRVGNGAVLRVLPDPLDAAFAALGNDQAASLLEAELNEYPYAADLAAMRAMVDAHPAQYWDSSLYTLWLGALRSLSPSAPDGGPGASGLPTVATTEPWGRRLLNTQLGSWAELRHDTLLYVKQSYTVGTECVYPDAYVDPYPELFAKLVQFAERGQELLTKLEFPPPYGEYVGPRLSDYFATLANVATTLREMAEHQRTGLAHSDEHLTFINDAVQINGGSGPPTLSGWYHQLFYDPSTSIESDPTIADVHTDPGGDYPPREASVLHVGTGEPRLMVVTVDSCEGPHAYVGAVFAYHEHLASGLTRLTDSEWATLVQSETPPPDVPWIEPIVAQ